MLYITSILHFCTSVADVLVLPLHSQTQFHCITPDKTYDNKWNVNGTMVASNSTFPGVVGITSRPLSNGSTKGSLTFTAYAQANNTSIRCFVVNGVQTITELEYYIVIQGTQCDFLCVYVIYDMCR